jgi:hypothetical protein
MAGLLSDVLPFLYSQGDRAKRYVGGLLSDPMGSLEQTGGGLLDAHRAQQGLLAQAFSNQARPFQVTDKQAMGQAAQNMLAGPLGMAPAGITAWHGSPHVFDKFDSSKIGTGEGAQAYGHGLYLAENPGVAGSYKTAGQGHVPLEGLDATRYGMPEADAKRIAGKWIEYSKVNPKEMHYFRVENPKSGADLIVNDILDGKVKEATGSLYKVDLPDNAVAKMLDWDKPLSQQTPEVQRFGASVFAHEPRFDPAYTRGMEVYQELNAGNGPAASLQAAQRLRAAGIPGIRYLDGGSRSAGQGSSNFVVFPGEENILQILERNGVPLR